MSESLYDEFRESHYAPPPLLRRMVDAAISAARAAAGSTTTPGAAARPGPRSVERWLTPANVMWTTGVCRTSDKWTYPG